MKNIEDMTEKELLGEIVRNQRKNGIFLLITAASGLIAAALMLFLVCSVVPKAEETLDRIDVLVENSNSMLEQADTSLKEIEDMINSINDLVEENKEVVNSTLKSIDGLNIDALNRSIKNLKDVVEPLTKLFGLGE